VPDLPEDTSRAVSAGTCCKTTHAIATREGHGSDPGGMPNFMIRRRSGATSSSILSVTRSGEAGEAAKRMTAPKQLRRRLCLVHAEPSLTRSSGHL